jgi:hypothetical protein
MQNISKEAERRGSARAHISSLYYPQPLLFSETMLKTSQVNRNKKSVGLSFQHKSGVEILHKLAAESDILVENYLPGTLKKYGMDIFDTSRLRCNGRSRDGSYAYYRIKRWATS